MKQADPEEYAAAERDALAILAAFLREDWDVLTVFEQQSNRDLIVTATFNLLLDALSELGADPAEWIAGKQAALLAREAESGS